MKCRFKFGRFFTKQTIVTKILQNMIKGLDKRSNILYKVKSYIDINLHPSNKVFWNDRLIREIFSSIEIIEDDYYWTFFISTETEYEIDLKRISSLHFVNNPVFKPVLLKGWETKLDIDLVHNCYNALTYTRAYF